MSTTPDDERAAAQFFADNPSAALVAWDLYRKRALSTHTAQAAEGWHLVPKEPTPEMWDSAWKSIGLPYRAKLSLHELKVLFDKFHAAMLAAAPQPATHTAQAEIQRLRALLQKVADEPSIDRARALADAEVYGSGGADSKPGGLASTEGLGPAPERAAFEAWAMDQWGRVDGAPHNAWLGFAAGMAAERERRDELTDDMLRYAMAAMGTGAPADADKFRRFWRFAIEARNTRA